MRYLGLLFVLFLSSCYNPGHAVILECDDHVDCIAEDATCENRICQCPTGKTYSLDGSNCLDVSVGFGAPCTEDTQCAWLLGKHSCKSGVCGCDSGYRYYHGKCIVAKGLKQSCERPEDCHVSNDVNAMVCTEGLCDCNSGYYARGHYDCRPIGNEVGAACSIDNDCQFDGGFCDGGKCGSSQNKETKTKKLQVVQEPTRNASLDFFAIGDSCVENDDCKDTANSFCSPITNKCMCRRGYFLSGNKCVGELGLDVGCSSDSDCGPIGSICDNNKCVCPLTHFHNAALNRCYKASVSPDFFCSNDIGCEIWDSKAKCVEITIFDSACECPFGSVLDKDTYLCIADEVTCGSCVEDEDCTSIQNAICNYGECECPNNYRLETNICLPNLGASCDHVNRQCELEYSECVAVNNIDTACKCIDGYLQLNDMTCLKIADIDEPCSENIQCTSFSFGGNRVCSNGKCQCTENHSLLQGVCLQHKSAGEYCVNEQQCKSDVGSGIQCRNSICQCPAKMEPTEDGRNCRARSGASNIITYYSSLSVIVSMIALYILH